MQTDDPDEMNRSPANPSQQQDDGMTSVRDATVIEPDGGVHKRGNWDDVMTKMSKGAPDKKPGTEPGKQPPDDIWDKKAQADQQKNEQDQKEVPDIPIIKHKGAEPADTTPITPPAEPLVQPPASEPDTELAPPTPQPEVFKDKADSEKADKPKPTLQIMSPPAKQPSEPESSDVETDSTPTPQTGAKKHDKEVQGKLTARLVHFGEAAVDAAVLPLVSTEDMTANLLVNGLGAVDDSPSDTEEMSSEPMDHDTTDVIEEIETEDEDTKKDMTLTETVMHQYGIAQPEATARIHEAIKKINAAAANNGSGEIARIINDTEGGEETIGVYMSVNGGTVLSMNPDDVIATLGRYLA